MKEIKAGCCGKIELKLFSERKKRKRKKKKNTGYFVFASLFYLSVPTLFEYSKEREKDIILKNPSWKEEIRGWFK